MSRVCGGYRSLRALLLATTAVVSLQQIPAAQAQQPAAVQGTPVDFNIPSQSLTSALTAFARQSGVRLAYPASLTAGKSAPALNGQMTRNAALSRLLSGSGLTYSFTGANTATISNPSAGGNTTAATVDGAIALDTIDVSGGGGSAAADLPYQTPGSASYISAEQMERIAPSRPGDVFIGTPGVTAGNKVGGSTNVNIRGAQGMGRVRVMVDGTQQESATYMSYFGNNTRSYFDPDLLGGVDINKGPSDGPHGSGAMGGVVNMKTITPSDILVPGATYGVRIRGSMGSNTIEPLTGSRAPSEAPDFLDIGSNRSGSIAAASTSEHFDFVAAVAKRQSGNYFAGKYGVETYNPGNPRNPTSTVRYSRILPGYEVPNTSEETTSTLLKGTLKLGDQSLELGYMRQDSEFGYSFPIWTTTNQFFLSPTVSNRYTAKYRYNPLNNDLIDLHVNAWGTDLSTREPYMRAVGQYQNILDTTAYGGEIWNVSQFSTPLGRAKITYGAEYSTSDFAVFVQPWMPPPTLKTRGSRELAGTFVRGALDVTDWLAFNAGVRYDRYRIEAISGTSAAEGNEGDAVLPSAGITVTPWEGIQFFGKYAQGYRPPSIQEIAGVRGESSGIIGGNPNLRPESSENWEFGINVLRTGVLRGDDKIRFKAAYFDNSYDDYITGGMTGCPPSSIMVCFTNVKSTLFRGVELSGDYDARTFFISASLNNYTDVQVSSNPDDIFFQQGMGYVPPKFTASGTIGVRLFDEKMTLGARINYTGQRASPYLYSSVYTTVRYTPHVTTVDLFGSYAVNESFKANFSVENLTDQYYVDPLAVTPIPAPGRTIRVGFEMKLGDQGNYGFNSFSMPQITTPTTGYNWSGAFIGVDGVYSVGDATAQGDVAGTFRTGSNPNYVWIPYSAATQTEHEPGGLGVGLFGGYNIQLNSPVVLGVDANFNHVSPFDLAEQSTATTVSATTARTLTTTVTSGMDWQAAVRGRIGLAFDKTLPYIAGGLAMAGYNYGYSAFAMSGATTTRTLPDTMRLKDTYLGWTLGAGVEHALTDHLMFRAEYRYSDFGKKTFDTPAGTHQVDLTSNEWRMGLAYKF